MNTQHTPGPWKWDPEWSADWKYAYEDLTANEVTILQCCHNLEGGLSLSTPDARLIAAAPDLLEALESALPFVEDAAEDEIYKSHRVHRVLNEIRAAIAKATGEQA